MSDKHPLQDEINRVFGGYVDIAKLPKGFIDRYEYNKYALRGAAFTFEQFMQAKTPASLSR